MGFGERPLFDLNELPPEDEESDQVVCLQPQKALPSLNLQTPYLFPASLESRGLVNNNAFSHESSVSGFQPFVRPKICDQVQANAELKREDDPSNIVPVLSSMPIFTCEETKVESLSVRGSADDKSVDRGDGDLPKVAPSLPSREIACVETKSTSLSDQGLVVQSKNSDREEGRSSDDDVKDKAAQEQRISKSMDCSAPALVFEDTKRTENSLAALVVNSDPKYGTGKTTEDNVKGEVLMDDQRSPKPRETKRVETSSIIKPANIIGKRKVDRHKEAMLGRKRSRQTMFLNIEEAKQAGLIKMQTSRRQNLPPPVITRTVKEASAVSPPTERVGLKRIQSLNKHQKQEVDVPFGDISSPVGSHEPESKCSGEIHYGIQSRPRRSNGDTDMRH